MADFQANIRAVLDTGGIENQIKNEINNRKIHFNNITLDTTDLVQKIQNALMSISEIQLIQLWEQLSQR